jgi:hypothetical protein
VDLSICLLLYGDHRDLALRCLGSLTLSGVSDVQDKVRDIRVGMNEVCDGTRAYVELWASKVSESCKFPVITFERLGPFRPTKYPMMRRMFYYPPHALGECVMWFDDDSYVVPRRHDAQSWWEEIFSTMADCDMLGQEWERPLSGKQRLWVYRQPWFDPEKGLPDKLRFCQGAWWCTRSALLASADYPFEDLQHNGGDSMLGELARHKDWRITYVPSDYRDVRINADYLGEHSAAPRRGITKDQDIGVLVTKASLPHSDHQSFKSLVRVYKDGCLAGEETVDGNTESESLRLEEGHGCEASGAG